MDHCNDFSNVMALNLWSFKMILFVFQLRFVCRKSSRLTRLTVDWWIGPARNLMSGSRSQTILKGCVKSESRTDDFHLNIFFIKRWLPYGHQQSAPLPKRGVSSQLGSFYPLWKLCCLSKLYCFKGRIQGLLR